MQWCFEKDSCESLVLAQIAGVSRDVTAVMRARSEFVDHHVRVVDSEAPRRVLFGSEKFDGQQASDPEFFSCNEGDVAYCRCHVGWQARGYNGEIEDMIAMKVLNTGKAT